MGTMTISVDDDTEADFRLFVKQHYGKQKGVLGKAVDTALQKLMEADKQREIAQRQLALMEKGFNMGKWMYKSRDELYERQ